MNSTDQPFVTVIIPTRNEGTYVGPCLRSILEGTYPQERMEILVVDGCSEDRTREIVREFAARHTSVRLLENAARVVPHAMNIGIRAAKGEFIVRMDAHATYPADYVAQLLTWKERLGADNVGGVFVTQPACDSSEARAVAVVLSHWFGVGNAWSRLEGMDTPAEVDTVPFGCYRRNVFDRIGLFDEVFVRNQDDEFNARLKKAGGKIFLVPEIKIQYVARSSLRKLGLMLYQYGYFKPLVALRLGRPATWRQLVPPVFTVALLGLPFAALAVPWTLLLWIGVIVSHGTVNLAVSVRQAQRKGWKLFPLLFGAFLLAHVAYGLGYLKGAFDFAILRRHMKNTRNAPDPA